MKRTLARLLVALALLLLALAKWLDSGRPTSSGRRRQPAPPSRQTLALHAQVQVELKRSHYRIVSEPPGQWEVIRIGIRILFSSVAFGMGVSYG